VYADCEHRFDRLPVALRGGDFVQAADADREYSAMDLMEVTVKNGAVVFLAHDDRLPRPEWLQRQFKPTAMKLRVDRSPMTVFEHHAAGDENLTLGANSDGAKARSSKMYVVFVTGGGGERKTGN
jgi:beta-galactosidase